MISQINILKAFSYAGATFNIFYANKGDGLNIHQHTFNHATACQVGSCAVRVKGKEFILTIDSQPIDLLANEPHEIEALEDGTVFVNIFAEGKY
jgi:quercetin dioxygenase-like cupin family protein